jgi:hypothetical protein
VFGVRSIPNTEHLAKVVHVRPVSAAFLRTLQGSHRMFARVKVVVAYQEGTQPTGYEIDIVDGNVRSDASSDVRSTLALTTTGVDAWPYDVTDLLAPYGNELFVERGINYGNGTIEIVSLGYFRIDRTDQDEGPDGIINISASDRMSGLIDARLPFPVQFSAGTTVADVFDVLVHEVYPNATIEYDFAASGSTFDTTKIAEEDRFAFLRDIAKSRGKIMYWDYRGVLQVVSPPDPTVPVYEINSGRGGTMITLSRSLSRQGVYNGVVARGDQPTDDVQPIALVVDNNPASPTYWNGRFGKVPRYYYSSFITTVAQATSAATSILQQAIGLPYSIELNAIPNPALEPYDSIKITAPDVTDVHVVDSINIPLTYAGTMAGTTRKLITFEPGDLAS